MWVKVSQNMKSMKSLVLDAPEEYTVSWDNVQKNFKARHEKLDKGNTFILRANAYVTKHRVPTRFKPGGPTLKAMDIGPEYILPSTYISNLKL